MLGKPSSFWNGLWFVKHRYSEKELIGEGLANKAPLCLVVLLVLENNPRPPMLNRINQLGMLSNAHPVFAQHNFWFSFDAERSSCLHPILGRSSFLVWEVYSPKMKFQKNKAGYALNVRAHNRTVMF